MSHRAHRDIFDADGDPKRGGERKRVKDISKCLISDALDPTSFRVPPPTPSVPEITAGPTSIACVSRTSETAAERHGQPARKEDFRGLVARYESREQSGSFNIASSNCIRSTLSRRAARPFLTQSATVGLSKGQRRPRLFLHLSSGRLPTLR